MEPSLQWLAQKNKEYKEKDIPHKQRPILAIIDCCNEFRCSFDFSSQKAKIFFQWFEKNSPKDTDSAGLMFQGAFYFDATFWPVDIKVFYGSPNIDPFKSLKTMPQQYINEIQTDPDHLNEYLSLWADCIDYIINYQEIVNDNSMNDVAKKFIKSGHKEVTASTSLLINRLPQDKAIESSRMAIEMHLKCIIIRELNWDENKLRNKISHNLTKAANKVLDTINNIRIQELSKQYSLFPEIHERYDGNKCTSRELWARYLNAIGTASAFSRIYGSSNIRDQITKNNKSQTT
jgi:hypothetical protein